MHHTLGCIWCSSVFSLIFLTEKLETLLQSSHKGSKHYTHTYVYTVYTRQCCSRQPGEEIQIGPNWDLSKALNNRYRLLLLRIDRYPGHFGVQLIKIHLLAFVAVAIKQIISPEIPKNLFSGCLHLNLARSSSVGDTPGYCRTLYITLFYIGIWSILNHQII